MKNKWIFYVETPKEWGTTRNYKCTSVLELEDYIYNHILSKNAHIIVKELLTKHIVGKISVIRYKELNQKLN